MPMPDDERFETYLNEFHPLVPDALPMQKRARHWVIGMWSAGTVALIMLGVISFRITHSGVARKPTNPPPVSFSVPLQPLTIRDANSLLAAAPSYKVALDRMAFHGQDSTVPKDKQSALAVLAKEKIKL